MSKWPESGSADMSKDYRKVIGDEESLAEFLRAMSDFDHRFCDSMAAGSDFTLRLEIHGNCGELIHCRVNSDDFRRPKGVEREVDRKMGRK